MKRGWFLSIRSQVPLGAVIVLGMLPILLALGLWWYMTAGAPEERCVSPNILPSPAEVFSPSQSIRPLVQDRDLKHHVLVSLRRVGLSYLLALTVVAPLGVMMGSFSSARAVFSPTTTASGYIPIATLVPLTMSWFGTGEEQKVVFLAMAFAIYLLPMIIGAIERVPDVYVRTASTMGAGRWQVIWRVLVPVALPEIWNGMRLAFGVGWTYLVLAEVVVLDDGLGYLVAISQRRGPREHIYLVILTITLIAWIADLGWSRLGRLLFPYRSTAK